MINLIFFFSGLIAVTAQTLLLREMLVVFQGNELSIGIILSQWMIGAAFGSAVVSRKIKPQQGLFFTFLSISIMLIAAFLMIRNLRGMLNLFPGEGFSLGHTIWASFLIFFPLSSVIGAQFSLGVRWAQLSENRFAAGRVYKWESAGYLAGGVIFTYVFLSYLTSASVILVCVLACLTACALLTEKKAVYLALAAMALLAGMIIPELETITAKKMYGSYDIKEIKNSPYGQVAVAQKQNEKYFYFDGTPMRTLPDADIARSEEFGFLSLLFHPEPKNVLLIGGAGRYITSVLDYSDASVDYTELDPSLIKMLKKHWPEDYRNELENQRVNLHYLDGRRYLEKNEKQYDVLLIGIPYPVTLSLNRFFTAEFFSLVKQSLTAEGIAVLELPGSLVYIDDSLGALTASVLSTLREVFTSVKALPGDNTLIIASMSPSIAGIDEVKKRFAQKRAAAKFISSSYIDYRLDPKKEKWLNNEVKKHTERNLINYDFMPRSLTASLIYWQAVFSPRFASAYSFLAEYSWILWVFAVIWLISGKAGFSGTAFTSGATGMGLQMISIWALQVFSGLIYHWIGLLSAVFMAGLAVGSACVQRYGSGAEINKIVLKIEAVLCLWIIMWWLLIRYSLIPWQLLFVFSAGSGVFLGLEFPLVVSARAQFSKTAEGEVAGRIYASELAGSWLSALLVGALLIPVWGLDKSLLLLLMLKAVSLRWWIIKANIINHG